MNEWAQNIASNPIREITYKSLESEELFGCVILPTDYVPGRRYPLLTWVYAGASMDAQCNQLKKNSFARAAVDFDFVTMRLAASRGYVVLLPSMPIHLNGEADVPLVHFRNGVLPAVDNLISLGLADPDRLFVAGQSFGGFSTYGPVTQTGRFKAAAAFGGVSDLTSAFGSAEARPRYREYLQEMFSSMEMIEEGQYSLGLPSWKAPDRYRRASPVSYVEDVVTPVMMLVRYWGEGHCITSPASVRDVWSRLIAWFDNYGDIARHSHSSLIFDGDRVRSRDGAPALTPEDFLRFDSP
jgi:dipeptidyl aminopeptidase/acylaminoacyl peptidase